MADSLFYYDPMVLQQQRQAALNQQAAGFANLSPQQQADMLGYRFGNTLGQGIGSLLGVEDQGLKAANAVNAVVKETDMTDEESVKQAAIKLGQMGYKQAGEQMFNRYQELAKNNAVVGKTKAETAKLTAASDLEEKLRAELSKLPPDASDAEIEQVVRKYGKPDEIFKAIERKQQAATAATERAKLQQDKLTAEAQSKQQDRDLKLQIAQMTAAMHGAMSGVQRELMQARIDKLKQDMEAKKEAQDTQKAGVEASFNTSLETIDTLKNHPGKEGAVGFGGKTRSYVPGTNEYGFRNQLETFKAQTFIPQVTALKGMGALSDAEGKKLTDAVGALDQGMKPAEFDKQLNYIETKLKEAKSRVTKKPVETGTKDNPIVLK